VKLKLSCLLLIALWLGASRAWADSLELKNGSLIKGKFLGGTERDQLLGRLLSAEVQPR
jgi:hypothetical protein